MSISGSGISKDTITDDTQPSVLPELITYLSFGFKLIITTMILLMAGWVFVTIKTTKQLHRSCNIFVANLMIADIVLALLGTRHYNCWICCWNGRFY